MKTLPIVMLALGLSIAACTQRPAAAPLRPSPEVRFGQSLDRSDIERIGATRTTDLLRALPGVRIVAGDRAGGGLQVELARAGSPLAPAGCAARLFVNGNAVVGASIDDLVAPARIEAIEVHTGDGLAGGVAAGAGGCGIVVIRTVPVAESAESGIGFTLRTEAGAVRTSSLRPQTAGAHPWRLNEAGTRFLDGNGEECDWLDCPNIGLAGQMRGPGDPATEWNTIMREAWPGPTYAHLAELLEGGGFARHHLTAAARRGGTRVAATAGHSREHDPIPGVVGFQGTTLHLDIGHAFHPSLDMHGGLLHSRSRHDAAPDLGLHPIHELGMAPPGSNLRGCTRAPGDDLGPGDDCTAPSLRLDRLIAGVSPTTSTLNPLYWTLNREVDAGRRHLLANLGARWSPNRWMELAGGVSHDRARLDQEVRLPDGWLGNDGNEWVELNALDVHRLGAEATGALRGPLGAWASHRTEVRVEHERIDEAWEQVVEMLAGSLTTEERVWLRLRRELAGATTTLFLGQRYALDAHVRAESLSFLPAAGWNAYYRIGGAWRPGGGDGTALPGLDHVALRASLGTAGPALLDEAYRAAAFVPSIHDLEPERRTRRAIGIDAGLFGRSTLGLVHVRTGIEGQVHPFTPPAFTGFNVAFANAGAGREDRWEAWLGAELVRRPGVDWSVRLAWDRSRQIITRLDIPPYRTGPANMFYVHEGATLGTIHGWRLATTCADLPPEVVDGVGCDQFRVNDDGFLVWVGAAGDWRDGFGTGGGPVWWGTTAPFSIHGTPVFWGTPLAAWGADPATGNPTPILPLGSVVPDHTFRLASSLSLGRFTLHALADAVLGVSLHDQAAQFAIFRMTSAALDQSHVGEDAQKPVGYHRRLYALTGVMPASFVVHDASYARLRTVSARYDLAPAALARMPLGGVAGLAVTATGRNLLTLTSYRGLDPEVGRAATWTGGAAVTGRAGFAYPNFPELSLAVEIGI